MTALIDADLILYRIGFTTQDVDDSNIVADRIDNLVQNTIIANSGAEDYLLYFSGKENYRLNILTDYKLSRKKIEKPRHYQWIRDYLNENYVWYQEDPYEADDLLGINQTEDTIICSIDKDLLQIPGHHFNFVTQQHIYITPEQGYLWFCKQLLIGDSTDDIPGVPLLTKSGISSRLCFGEKSCEKYLDGKEDPLSIVIDIYKKVFKDDWLKELNLRGSLVHIRQDYISEESPIWSYNE